MKKNRSGIVDLFVNSIERFFEIVEFIQQREKSANLENAAYLIADADNSNQPIHLAQSLDGFKDGSQAFTRDLGQRRKLEHHVDHSLVHCGAQLFFKLYGHWLTDIATGSNDQYLIPNFGLNRHGIKYGIVFSYCSSAELKINNYTK